MKPLNQGKLRAQVRLREFIGAKLHSRKNSLVLCTPKPEAREIENVYRKLGFQDRHIIGVHQDGKTYRQMAEHYPNIKSKQISLEGFSALPDEHLIEELARGSQPIDLKPFSVVSLDLDTETSHPLLLTPLLALTCLGRLENNVVVAVNFLKQTEVEMSEDQDLSTEPVDMEAEERRWDTEAMDEIEYLVGEEADRFHLTRRSIFKGCRIDKSRMTSETKASFDQLTADLSEDELEKYLDVNSVMIGGACCRAELLVRIKEYLEMLQARKPLPLPDGENIDSVALEHVKLAYHAFLIRNGFGYMLRDVERYSYIDDSGRTVNADYLHFQKLDERIKNHIYRWVSREGDQMVIDPILAALDLAPFAKTMQLAIVGIDKRCYSLSPTKRSARIALGGGSVPLDEEKVRAGVIEMLKKGRTDEEILAKYPITVASVRSYRGRFELGDYVEVF